MAGRQRRKRNNARRPNRLAGSIPAGYMSTLGTQSPRYTNGPSGHLIMSHEELFFTPTISQSGDVVATKPFLPGSSGLPMLDAIAKIYDKYRILGIKLHWRTSVGTTTAGAVILAIDGEPSNKGNSISYVQSLVPKFRGPVWQEGTVVGRPAELMSQRWLGTGSSSRGTDSNYAAFLAVLGIASAQASIAYGEVWCQYTVEFAFPAAVSGK